MTERTARLIDCRGPLAPQAGLRINGNLSAIPRRVIGNTGEKGGIEPTALAASIPNRGLESYFNVAIALADNIAGGLTGLLLIETAKGNELDINDIARRLESEKLNLELLVTLNRLFRSESRLNFKGFKEYAMTVRTALTMALQSERHYELEHIVMSLRRALRRLGHGNLRRLRTGRDELSAFWEIIDPRMVAEVARANTEAALSLCQAADEVGDVEWSYRFQREFFELVFRRNHPVEIFERNPEAVVAWAEFVRRSGGWRFVERYGDKLVSPEFIYSGLSPHHLLELSKRHPKAALVWVQIIREISAGRIIERHGTGLFERPFDTQELPELIERSPDVALAWLQLLRDCGGGLFKERFEKELLRHEFFERALHPRRLLELAEGNPEAALTWMLLAREFGGERLRSRLHEELVSREFLERIFDPRHLFELSERNPEALVLWVQLIREVGDGRYDERLFPNGVLEEMLRPPRLLDLVERSPEGAMAFLEVATEVSGGQFIRRHGEELFDRTFDTFVLSRLLHEKPVAFAVVLRIARAAGWPRGVEVVADCLASVLHGFGINGSVIENLPISALPDLEWLANESKNMKLIAACRKLSEKRAEKRM